ncbi:hypothetical protein SALBM311S_09153 [Streptomyces alboniger]
MALRIGAARAPQATTFHSFCYALVRAHQDTDLFVEPLRLLSGPDRTSPSENCWPARPDPERLAVRARGRPDERERLVARAVGAADESASPPAPANSASNPIADAHRPHRPPDCRRGRSRRVPRRARPPGRARLCRTGAPRGPPRPPPRGRRTARRPVRRRLRRRVPGHRPGAGTAAARPGRRWSHPGRLRRPRPVDLRLQGRGRERHPGVPPGLPARGRPPRAGGSAAHLPPLGRRPADRDPAADAAHAADPAPGRQGARPPGTHSGTGRRQRRGPHVPDARHRTGQRRRHPPQSTPGGRCPME